MPWPGQPAPASPAPSIPALFLYPTNDSFIPKMISLVPSGTRVKIGRQTNNKTVPGERNGYFDSKVLSRQHAEVWEENSKIFIKDVRSSNGTFVNGERLSVEGMESEPWELKSDDRVEFGIDIVGEDNKTIIHHKVAATVFCVITPEDYAQLNMHHLSPFHNNNGGYLQANQQRRPSLQQAQSPVGLGGLGGGPTLGLSGRTGKSGLTFDHILSRLQNELQKSRETGSELNSLAGVITDINDNLVGGAHPPAHNPLVPLPPVRPPVVPPSTSPIPSQAPTTLPPEITSNLSNIQSQLMQTQSALANHADKVKSLEGVIAEHESVKREVQLMRDLMEQRKIEMESFINNSRMHSPRSESGMGLHSAPGNDEALEAQDDDDDDARSVVTLGPGDGPSDHREDVKAYQTLTETTQYEEDDDDRRARTEAMTRPRTPEPHGIHDEEDEDFSSDDEAHPTIRHKHFVDPNLPVPSKYPTVPYPSPNSPQRGSTIPFAIPSSEPTPSFSSEPSSSSQTSVEDLHSQNNYLANRLEVLAQQLDTALSLSRTLHDTATAAHSNIEKLEAKVKILEAFVEATKSQQEAAERAKEDQRTREAEEAARLAATGATDDKHAPLRSLGSSSLNTSGEGAESFASPQPQVFLTELWDSWRTRIEGQWRVEREEWEVERLRLQSAVREWQERMTSVENAGQKRNTQGEELIQEMRRERAEAIDTWKKQQVQVEVQMQTQSELMRSIQQFRANQHSPGPFSSDDDENSTGLKPRLLNGVSKKTSRRHSSSKLRKQRRSSQSVSTPPLSPTLVNTERSTLGADVSSTDESASPIVPSGKSIDSVFVNGHIKGGPRSKSHVLPLSPAASIRQDTHDGSTTREGSSAASEPDSATLVNDDASSVGTAHGVFPGKSLVPTNTSKSRQLHETPLPYIGASVVIIGVAAWVFASRTKD